MNATKITAALCIVSMSGLAMAQNVSALQGPGGGSTVAHDINDFGQVVGQSNSGLSISTTLWDASGVGMNLGTAAGYDTSFGYAINNSGQVVGYSELNATGMRTATLWDNGRITDIGADMRAIGSSVARDINDLGQIVGGGAFFGPFGEGFLWDSNGGQVVGTQYMGGSNLGINNNGVMVGHSFFFGDPDTASIAMPDDRGGYFTADLGPAGFNFSFATAINDNGMSVGHTNFGTDGAWQAAIFTTDLVGPPGPPALLGSLDGLNTSEANDVNDHGMIVGYSWDGTHSGIDSRAWAWADGTMYDLNNLLDEDSMFSLLIEATGVNNNGDIVGYGLLHDGSTSAFVIEGFVPAPSALGLLAMGGLLSARRKRPTL
jgi:probable HAF family extracellular repeat protein